MCVWVGVCVCVCVYVYIYIYIYISGYLEQSGCTADIGKPSGVYQINPQANMSDIVRKDVYCDMDTDGGGWTVSYI